MRLMLYRGMIVNVTRRATEETPGGGVTHRTVPDGQKIADVEVELDEHMLRQMAEKALKARSRKAVVGNGLIKCVARNVRHEGGQS